MGEPHQRSPLQALAMEFHSSADLPPPIEASQAVLDVESSGCADGDGCGDSGGPAESGGICADGDWCGDSGGPAESGGICAICLNRILIQETALVKGCEHAYCVTCILRWATYSQKTCCPQCKNPFEFLNVHRSLDGCIHDYMFEESVCLLLRATWFVPLVVEPGYAYEEVDDLSQYYHNYEEDDEDDDDDTYFPSSSSSIRIGNRRWGGNGYVRGGRKEARPRTVDQQSLDLATAGPSDGPKKEAVQRDVKGRRAKRAMKREAADKAAAAKHQLHLQRLGRC